MPLQLRQITLRWTCCASRHAGRATHRLSNTTLAPSVRPSVRRACISYHPSPTITRDSRPSLHHSSLGGARHYTPMPAIDGPRHPSSSSGSSGARGPLEQSSSTNTTQRAPSSGFRVPSKLMQTSSRSVSAAVPPSSLGRDENRSRGNADDYDDDEDELGAVPRKPSSAPKARRSLGGSSSRLTSSNYQGQRSSSRADGHYAHPSSDASGPSYPSSGPGAAGAASTSRTASSSHTNRSGMSALARANANARRISVGPPVMLGGAGPPGQLEAVKKLNVDSTSFDEWMKMATDNVSRGMSAKACLVAHFLTSTIYPFGLSENQPHEHLLHCPHRLLP